MYIYIRTIKRNTSDGGGSNNPNLNSPLRIAVEEALKRNMPNSTIQGVLKRCANQTAKLKRHAFEIRYGLKVFMVVVVYTDNVTSVKMNLAPILRKAGASYADTTHMFYQKGIVEVAGNDKLDVKTSNELEEIATDHAIESGAEELEIIDPETNHLTVRNGVV